MFPIIFWKVLVFQCKSDSPQVKQDLIFSIPNFVQVASRNAASLTQDLRKLGNNWKFSKLCEDTGQCPMSPAEINFQQHPFTKGNIRAFQLCSILLNFLFFAEYFDNDYMIVYNHNNKQFNTNNVFLKLIFKFFDKETSSYFTFSKLSVNPKNYLGFLANWNTDNNDKSLSKN